MDNSWAPLLVSTSSVELGQFVTEVVAESEAVVLCWKMVGGDFLPERGGLSISGVFCSRVARSMRAIGGLVQHQQWRTTRMFRWKGKVIDLCSIHDLWWWALGHIVDSNSRQELPRRASGLIWRELGVQPSSHQEEAAEEVHLTRVPPGRLPSRHAQLGRTKIGLSSLGSPRTSWEAGPLDGRDGSRPEISVKRRSFRGWSLWKSWCQFTADSLMGWYWFEAGLFLCFVHHWLVESVNQNVYN